MSLVPLVGEESIFHASDDAIVALMALSRADEGAEDGNIDREGAYNFEIERLKIWITQHDARTGRLDYKLREASGLREQVLRLLNKLSDLAIQQDGTEKSVDASLPDDESASSSRAKSSDGGVKSLSSEQSEVTDGRSVQSHSSSIDTKLSLPSLSDSPLASVRNTVTLLLELSPALLDPAPQSRFEHSLNSDAANYDINHISARFPRADETLAERLGRANWARRQKLSEIRREQEKTSTQVQKVDPTELLAEDIKLDQSDYPSDAEDVDSSDSENDHSAHTGSYGTSSLTEIENTEPESIFSDPGLSRKDTQITTPTTVSKSIGGDQKHQTGFMTPPDVEQRYMIPPPPSPNQGLTGKTFLCPYCSYMVSGMQTVASWKRHVFEDLEPYMCTYAECMSSAKTYGSRKLWWNHEKERHRTQRSWICGPCGQKKFDTAKSFEIHVSSQHKFKPTQIHGIQELCKTDTHISRPRGECPLCKEKIKCTGKTTSKAFKRAVRKHVSDHLEQLAYFVAVPAGEMMLRDDESEFQDDSDSEDDMKSEIMSVATKDTRWSKKEIQRDNVKFFLEDQQKAIEETGKIPGFPSATSSMQRDRHGKLQTSHGRQLAPKFPIRMLPYPQNEHFYSRQPLLTDADKVLHPSGHICIFHGVGGVGKTMAAVQYIYAHETEFDAVFWLLADTPPGLSDSYLQMVTALGIVNGTEDHNRILDVGRNWLQDTDKRWLIVFDNAIEWPEISRFMPNDLRNTNGSVLITTQNERFLPKTDNVTHIRLEPLSQQAGGDMLLRYLGKDIRTDPERNLAREISSFVGGLPVTIAHVAGYVSSQQITLDELIEIFQQWRKRVGLAVTEEDDLPSSFREASTSYEETLAMVREVTLRELNETARNLLNIVAYLNCAAVPKNMIWALHEDESLNDFDPREKISMRKVNESLIKRRLVTLDAESCFSMHRSLQRGIREKLSRDKDKQQKVFDQAVAVVRRVFPRSNPLQQPSPEKWSECRELIPHLDALRDVYQNSKPDIKGSLDFAQLLLDAGMDQFEQGITHEGLLLLNTAESVLEASSPEEHQAMRADIHAMIAIMYDDIGIGKRQDSLIRRKKALDIRRKIFEDSQTPKRQDEMLLYNSQMEYAISLLHYHRYAEAEPIIERCLSKFKEWGPEEEIPFEYAKYYNKIAFVRMYQGRFEEAVGLAEHGVQLMERAGYKMFSARFKFDLACIILQSGDLDEALRVHRDVYDQRLEMVGRTNELTLHSVYAIGAIHELGDDFYEAEAWLRSVIDQRRSLTSWPDEALSRAQFHLAKVLLTIGRPDDIEYAQGLRDKAIRVLNKLLPLDMPPELKGVTDEGVLFDHMLPVSPGGPRFTGRDLLQYFMPKS